MQEKPPKRCLPHPVGGLASSGSRGGLLHVASSKLPRSFLLTSKFGLAHSLSAGCKLGVPHNGHPQNGGVPVRSTQQLVASTSLNKQSRLPQVREGGRLDACTAGALGTTAREAPLKFWQFLQTVDPLLAQGDVSKN